MKKYEQQISRAFAFVDGWGEDDQLRDRTVIVHCPTGTIVEALLAENALSINNDMQTMRFNYTGASGIKEQYIMVLHVSPTFDKDIDRATIYEVMKGAAKWFAQYMEWEDNNIMREALEGEEK